MTDALLILAMGHAPPDATEAYAGATLIPLAKAGNGVRPIASGTTYRRITAKAVATVFRDDTASKQNKNGDLQ